MDVQIKHDPEADALYLRLLDEPSVSTETIDDSRFIDFTASGRVKGVEFLDVSRGMRVVGLPFVDSAALVAELRRAGFRIIDGVSLTGQASLPSSTAYAPRMVESQPRLTTMQGTVYVPPKTVTRSITEFKPTPSGSVTISVQS